MKARREAIVDEKKLWKIQELLKKNSKSRHNSVEAVKHNYIVNGVLFCARYGSDGRSNSEGLQILVY